MAPSSDSLQRQVDTMLATLEGALESGVPAVAAPPPLALATSSFSLTDASSTASKSPFSLNSGNMFAKRSAPSEAPTATSAALSLTQLEARIDAPAPDAPCTPYDGQAFLLRLGSFAPNGLWHDKPNAVSAPTCARHGWTCSGMNMLSCRVCGACLAAPQQLTTAASDAELTAALAAQLTTAHAELCPWRGNASPASIGALLLPAELGTLPTLPHGVSIGREAMRRRSSSLLALTTLPKLSPAADEAWSACARACGFAEDGPFRDALIAISGLERSPASLSAAQTHRRWIGAALALVGWTAGAQPRTIECPEDARTVGLWSYQPMPVPGSAPTDAAPATPAPAAAATAAPPPVPLFGMPNAEGPAGQGGGGGAGGGAVAVAGTSASGDLPLFDPLAEHRAWSPWLATCPGDTLPAWMRIAVLLLPPDAPGRQQSQAAASTSGASVAAVARLLGSF